MSLQITRLKVEQLRRFRRPYELDGFEPGLNILSAPNAGGKSTLVRAIRAAFFERHRSTTVDDLRPELEGSGAAPRVELDFLLAGEPHRLVKSFLGKKLCTLSHAQGALEGVEAEDHLARRLGFRFAAKGNSKPEHWGIPGLLWVTQGTGHELDLQPARDHLHDALHAQAGASASALAASGGDEVLEVLKARRRELLTEGGKPTLALADAARLEEGLRAQRAELDAQIDAYRAQVDQLARLRTQHEADEADRPWERLREQLGQARAAQQALAQSEAELQQHRIRLRQLQSTSVLLAQQIDSLGGQKTQADQREKALAQARQDLLNTDAAVKAAQVPAEDAQAQVVTAQAASLRAREARQHAQLTLQLQQAITEHQRITRALEQARKEQERVQQLRAQAADAQTIDAPQLQRLQSLERAEREAALRTQAVATRLRFSLPSGQVIGLHTAATARQLQEEGEALIDGPARLVLPGGGELTISPGGDEIAQLASTHAEAHGKLRLALQAHGIRDLAQAEALHRLHVARQAERQLAEQAVRLIAPQGIEALEVAQGQAQAQRRAAQEALGRLPTPSADDAPPPVSPEQAEAAHLQAQAVARRAADMLSQAQQAQARAQGAFDTAQREHAAAQALLADPGRQQRLEDARAQRLQNTADLEALGAHIGEEEARLAQARPEAVAQDAQRLQRSIEQIEREHHARRDQMLQLAAVLQQAGAQGLEETRDTVAGQLAQATRRHDELRRRAQALDLLCRKLEQKRQATLARWQLPLSQRLAHYLPLLLPGASLRLDESLAPGQLAQARPGGAVETGNLQAQSFGTREQLGLISRFAYADLLREAGRPTLLILDDALVHSDEARRDRMKRVLFDAAQRHQVLLFTCHPQHWRDLGVPVRQLTEPA